MAKPIASRFGFAVKGPDPTDPMASPQRSLWWTPCKGMNTTLPAQLLSQQQLSWAENVGVHYGMLRSRPGVRNVGTSSASNITTVVEFNTSSGISYLVRMGFFGVEYFDGTNWNAIPGYSVPAEFTVFDKFACTAFGDKLVFSDGLSGLYEYDPVAGVAVLIPDGPSAKHLTTFASRIVASNVKSTLGLSYVTRIQWCAKNNSHDWTGIGSGYEDMLSTPGGLIDEQTGVYPVDDYQALVVRSQSTWQMTESGNVDAPFRFDRRYPGFGSKHRHSIVPVPGGIVGLFSDMNINFVTLSGIETIGDDIRDPRWSYAGLRVSRDSTNYPNLLAVGAYSSRQKKYAIALSARSAPGGVTGGFTAAMYEYDFDSKSWTYKKWPDQSIHWITYSTGTLIGLTIDSSPGTIDAAGTASIDSEVASVPFGEQDVLIGASGGYVYREDRTLYHDDTTAFGVVSISQACVSNQMVATSPIDSVVLVGFKMVYQSSVAGNITLRMHVWANGVETTTDYVIPVLATMDSVDQVLQGTRVAYVPVQATGYQISFEVRNSLDGRVDIIGVLPELEGKADVNTGMQS